MKPTEEVSAALLSGVTETLLLTARAKYVETQRKDRLFDDPKLEEMFTRVRYDFSHNKLKGVFIGGMVARTLQYDQLLLEFVAENPECTIICLGAGLDTRMARLRLQDKYWVDVDLPEVIDIREHFYEPSMHHRMLAYDVRDPQWMQEVPRDLPIIMLGEGLFPYLTPEENRELFRTLQAEFPGATLLFDLASPMAVKRRPYQANIKAVRAVLHWGANTGEEIDIWLDSPAFQEDYMYLINYPQRLPGAFKLALKLIPPLKHMGKVVKAVF